MKRITCLVPRTSDVTLGNRIFRIGEMRLSDLAALQTFLDDHWEDPLEALGDRLTGLQGRERQNILAGIWDACNEGPPVWGTHRAHKVLMEPEGLVKTFEVILGQHSLEKVEGKWVHLDLDREKVIDIAEQTGNHPDGWDQFDHMMSLWQPVEPIEQVAWMLGMSEVGPQGKPITFVEAVISTIEATTWTLDYVMGLTMRQFKAIRSGGKPKDYGQVVQPKTNLKAVVAARLAQIEREEAEALRETENPHG